MKGNSNNRPDAIVQMGDKVQVRWNITRNDRTNMDETVTESWDYEYVNCDAPERGAIIRAIMKTKYPLVDDEIAVINNKDLHPEQYDEYQLFRGQVKQIVDEAFQ